MRTFIATIIALMLMALWLAPAMAEDKPVPDNTLLVGGYVSNDTTTPLLSGAYRKFVSPRFYLTTFYDVSNIQFKPLNLAHAQYTGTEELWFYVASPTPKLVLFLRGGGGLVGTAGISTSRSLGGGGGADLTIGKSFHLMGAIGGNNNQLTGTRVEVRAYMGVGW